MVVRPHVEIEDQCRFLVGTLRKKLRCDGHRVCQSQLLWAAHGEGNFTANGVGNEGNTLQVGPGLAVSVPLAGHQFLSLWWHDSEVQQARFSVLRLSIELLYHVEIELADLCHFRYSRRVLPLDADEVEVAPETPRARVVVVVRAILRVVVGIPVVVVCKSEEGVLIAQIFLAITLISHVVLKVMQNRVDAILCGVWRVDLIHS
mmetsp:Transcript_104128/g.184911  ORF Transcript_104128/g.184911 Transcript_104128/m.184911 type:complete len:204 (-) Transcript_104128:868-1479(-)